MERELVFTFLGTSQAIQAEQVLLEAGVAVQVMPLPAVIIAGCGICLRVPVQDEKRAVELLRKKRVVLQQTYERSIENGKNVYTIWEG